MGALDDPRDPIRHDVGGAEAVSQIVRRNTHWASIHPDEPERNILRRSSRR